MITILVFYYTYVSQKLEGEKTKGLYDILAYEIDIFFSWLMASASFLLFVNITKFNSVWND